MKFLWISEFAKVTEQQQKQQQQNTTQNNNKVKHINAVSKHQLFVAMWKGNSCVGQEMFFPNFRPSILEIRWRLIVFLALRRLAIDVADNRLIGAEFRYLQTTYTCHFPLWISHQEIINACCDCNNVILWIIRAGGVNLLGIYCPCQLWMRYTFQSRHKRNNNNQQRLFQPSKSSKLVEYNMYMHNVYRKLSFKKLFKACKIYFKYTEFL